ncbi:MAG: tetratricopeptide repeat protein [Elusimicrobia bacterium]|nr:tetratricopeptide repeat protein [Elusimicrobiota bacterium]
MMGLKFPLPACRLTAVLIGLAFLTLGGCGQNNIADQAVQQTGQQNAAPAAEQSRFEKLLRQRQVEITRQVMTEWNLAGRAQDTNGADFVNEVMRRTAMDPLVLEARLAITQSSLNKENSNYQLLAEKGALLFVLGRPQEALAAFEQSLKTDRENALAFGAAGGMADAFRAMGRFDEAIEHYEMDIKFNADENQRAQTQYALTRLKKNKK